MRSFAMPRRDATAAPRARRVADNVRPTATQDSPTEGEVVLRTAPITFTGTASDDVAVARVRIAIKNLDNGRYLSNPNSTLQQQLLHDLRVPGGHAGDAGAADQRLVVHLEHARSRAGATARRWSR